MNLSAARRLLALGLLPLCAGCVFDRTGQSVTSQMHRQLADHDRRVRELEVVSEDASRRVGQLEEVTRARGQDEILKMETMEQLRQEVARIRGDFEVLQHDYGTYESAGLGFQQDSDYRMIYLENRVVSLERSLGVKAPAPPPRDGSTGATVVAAPPAPTEPDPVVAAPTSPEESFALLEKNLAEGNGGAARAVANRFILDNPKSDRVPEAHYRIAESWQNEGNFKSAAGAFQIVVDKYGQSTWAPWSMLRQAECFEALGEKAGAQIFYADVIRLYPKSKAAKEAKTHLDK